MEDTNKIKGLRGELGLKQEDIADYLNISIMSYNRKENEKKEFKESEINKLIKLFDKPYEKIFLDRKYSKCLQGGD